MKEYDFKEIEAKWQKIWEENNYGQAEDFSDKPKHYQLIEFPYPSGSGLHVGHCMAQGASDASCRMKRLQGFNVMYPIGYDAFGLPTENYAIRNKIKPQKATAENIANFRRQMKSLGFSFDWSREINTTDPDYFKWTQWIFEQFYKHAIVKDENGNDKLIEVADGDTTIPRLAFQAEMPVNWCPSCKIVLANEEVIGGNCERCGAQTEKRKQKQWMLRITAYADRLIKDLDTVKYLDKIKTQQINWIGKSVGSNIKFKIKGRSGTIKDEEIEVFTTRADTLFGCTYVVLSPEHPLVEKIGHHIQNFNEIKDYIEKAKKKSDLERTELAKEKTGVKLYGISAINPINEKEVDVWIADYVLSNYGTGAVMAVPAHDERDFEFANKYNIPIKQVIAPSFATTSGPDAIRDDKPTVKRRAVLGLVKHWEEDKYYLLNWEKFNWHTMVIGGVEKDETDEEAVKREVCEETGYQNIKSVKKIDMETINQFFARHKDENRYGWYNCYLVELADDEYKKPDPKEVKNHSGSWLSKAEADKFINLPNHQYYWQAYKEGEKAVTDYGILINSDKFNDLSSEDAKEKITSALKEKSDGDFSINFKLRDWIFSRQHYWGEPIPIIHCDECGMVPVPEDQLPVQLPDVENYEPTDTGESPLAKISDWVNTTCPNCGGKAKRETDTMPNWAGSSWYFLAYDMKVGSLESLVGSKNIFSVKKKELKYWQPVDIYNGGMEHTTLHLLYSRFWNKFLYDLGVAPTSEPYAKRIAHGIILGPDGRKMSKSFGNVINPDDIAGQYGADTLRAYIMFIGPYDQESAWSTAGVQGVYRFLKRVWKNQDLVSDHEDAKELLIKLNQTIAGVSEDLENFRMNTVISKLMEMNNTIEKIGHITKESFAKYLLMLYPATPHIASELFEIISKANINDQKWPEADKKYLVAEKIEIVVQVNGKVREKLFVDFDISDEKLKKEALNTPKIRSILKDKEIIKTIVVPKKLVSIVIK